tara:strand:- start:58 stop:597 length:540 start_codon:yes stop_codon:yes gene_type:complete
MEIRTTYQHLSTILFLALIGVFFSLQILANSNEDPNSVILEIDNDKNNLAKIDEISDPLENITIISNKIVDKLNRKISDKSNISNIALNNDEYIQIKGLDGRLLLFNGSIAIKFKSPLDLSFYADNNQLELISNLSSVNIGVFKAKNFADLQLVINKIKSDNNIVSITLDTVDPALKIQ